MTLYTDYSILRPRVNFNIGYCALFLIHRKVFVLADDRLYESDKTEWLSQVCLRFYLGYNEFRYFFS